MENLRSVAETANVTVDEEIVEDAEGGDRPHAPGPEEGSRREEKDGESNGEDPSEGEN